MAEYDVQEASGVLDQLDGMPQYDAGFSELIKQSTTYDLWVRPTISWKLECEGSFSRSDILTAMAKANDEADLTAMVPFFLGVFAFTSASCFGAIAMKFSWEHYKTMLEAPFRLGAICCLLIEFSLFLGALIVVIKQSNELEDRKQVTDALDSMDHCGDEFTKVPAIFSRELKGAAGKVHKSLIYAWLCVVTTLLSCCCFVVLGDKEIELDDDFERDNTVSSA